MTTEREDELIRGIGAWGIGDAPEGWLRVDMLFQVGRGHRLAIIVDEENKLEGSPAPEVTPLLQELYALMGRSWAKFRLVIDPPGSYRAWFLMADPLDLPEDKRIAEELLFLLPPGWASAKVQSRSALVFSVTGIMYPWTPPDGLVPDGAELVIKHPCDFALNRLPGEGAKTGETTR